jgi:chromosome segregation ATPase
MATLRDNTENGNLAAEETSEDATSISLTISELTDRATTLLTELETFRQHLRSIREEQNVELAHFRGAVQAEVGMLERLTKKLEDVNVGHIARSSNVPFLESIWDGAKRSRRLKSV